ncbi:MAG: hypothetical protein CMG24_06525 [Candidatus Marinimicrobia bacterium]|nr:hypothetical protein [Candidatus Neomarinimicrobiota bacterium]
MIHIVKIVFLFLFLFIIACDEDESSPNVEVVIYGCTNYAACNYNEEATNDDGTCELNIFCYDADGDGLGYGDSTQICLDDIPEGWVIYCDDPEDDCVGSKDDCGECNGNNNSKDCNEVCFGTAILDDTNGVCCYEDQIQDRSYSGISGSTISTLDIGLKTCLPDTFKWDLKMIVVLGDYNDGIFIPSSDSISTNFTIGTHYLSTDSLDILEDINYSDIVQPPSTVENSLYFYTSHPEWEYQFGNNFIQEYKYHNIGSEHTWDGQMTADYYGQKFISVTFELDTDSSIHSGIGFNFNNNQPVINSIYDDDYDDDSISIIGDCHFYGPFFSNNIDDYNLPCNVINPNFEYVVPITFQGPGYIMPFEISTNNTFIY